MILWSINLFNHSNPLWIKCIVVVFDEMPLIFVDVLHVVAVRISDMSRHPLELTRLVQANGEVAESVGATNSETQIVREGNDAPKVIWLSSPSRTAIMLLPIFHCLVVVNLIKIVVFVRIKCCWLLFYSGSRFRCRLLLDLLLFFRLLLAVVECLGFNDLALEYLVVCKIFLDRFDWLKN